jgi:hypothetical protein
MPIEYNKVDSAILTLQTMITHSNIVPVSTNELELIVKLLKQHKQEECNPNIVEQSIPDVPSPIRAIPMNLFPTMESMDSVIALGISQLPVMTPNSLKSIIYTYHNTLLSKINKD